MQEEKNKLIIDGRFEQEIRIALISKKGELTGYLTHAKDESQVGNIYLAKIEHIKESIDAVFVKISNEANAFLPFSAILRSYYKKTKKRNPKISDLLKKGQELIVQIVRDAGAQKAANASTYITLTGKNCIFLPNSGENHGVSKKIKGDDRRKIKDFLDELKLTGSVIVRTAAYCADIKEIKQEIRSLIKEWEHVQKKAEAGQKQLLKNDDLLKILRSYSTYSVAKVEVFNPEIYKKIRQYKARRLIKFPEIAENKDGRLFEKIEMQIQDLYKTQIDLKTGGSIIIEQTEALVSIDVNSKYYANEENLEKTAVAINLEAAAQIAKQVILRNLGGIIIIDFIDMEFEENINAVNVAVKNAFKDDSASVSIIGLSEFCIIQISRQRLHTSVFHKSYEPCRVCSGSGFTLNNKMQALQVIRQIYANKEEKITVSIRAEVMQEILSYYVNYLPENKKITWQINN